MKNLILKIVLLVIISFIGCSKDDATSESNISITGISPIRGPKNTLVTITGNNFGTDYSLVEVFFNGKQTAIETLTNNQITAKVAPKSFTGNVTVKVNGLEVEGPAFTYEITEIKAGILAGGSQGFSDGYTNDAQFNFPISVAVDNEGNILIADTNNNKIRKINITTGLVSTLAGSNRGFEDGLSSVAKFSEPSGIAVDAVGNVYVADETNHKIRKITPDGMVSTLAGSTNGFKDGAGQIAQFNFPTEVALDDSGNIYVVDTYNHKIRKITPDGIVGTLAGSTKGFANGTGAAAQFDFDFDSDITVDTAGNVYVADTNNHKIRKITPDGKVTTLAGSTRGSTDATGINAKFDKPRGITIDKEGNIYVSDNEDGNNKIRKISPPASVVSTLPVSGLGLRYSKGIAIDNTTKNIYIADAYSNRIRLITQE